MTNTTKSPSTQAPTTKAPSTQELDTPPDPRPAFATALDLAGAMIASVRPDQVELPTPCPRYSVGDMVGHMLGAVHRVAVVGRRGDLGAVPEIQPGTPDTWTSAWAEAAADARSVWSDDALLASLVTVPWAELPGAAALAIYVNEVTVHTWDLATATGLDPAWDDGVVELSLAAMQIGLPAEGRDEYFAAAREALGNPEGWAAPFAAAVALDADATPIDRLVAHNGRRP